MKKIMILILLLLPVVLIAIISVAGRVISVVTHISVEDVAFVDRAGSEYSDEFQFKVPQGGTRETEIYIYPELASNKKVQYRSSDTSICTVDENGVITGVKWGTATVTVKTNDGSKIATLNVLVTADVPFGVSLSHTEIPMYVGGTFDELEVSVEAPVSINKNVVWSSSDPEVAEVDELRGVIVAKAPGEAIITVTTVSGNKSATCKVTVSHNLPFSFDFSGIEGVENRSDSSGERYLVSTSEIDLSEVIKLGDGVTIDDVSLALDREDIASIDGGVLTFSAQSTSIVTLSAEYAKDGTAHKVVIKFMYTPS